MSFISSSLEMTSTYWPLLWNGIIHTILVSISGTLIGLLIGLVVGGIRYICMQHEMHEHILVRILKQIVNFILGAYVEIIRGTPMMVQAMFLYWGVKSAFQFNWDVMTASICIISLNTGAYMAEIIRSGIQSVDKGQGEGARSIGLTSLQTMQYVILPQAIKNAFPSIGNEFIVNIKDSSVLNIIGFSELFLQAKSIMGSTFDYVTPFFIVGVIYFVLTFITSRILYFIEKRMGHKHTSMPTSQTMPILEEEQA